MFFGVGLTVVFLGVGNFEIYVLGLERRVGGWGGGKGVG